jgi:hypothetical protein
LLQIAFRDINPALHATTIRAARHTGKPQAIHQ